MQEKAWGLAVINLTPEQAFELVSMLVKSYRSLKIEEYNITAYTAMIGDLDYETCKAAMLNLITESEYFPTIAAIRKAAVKATVHVLTGHEAWAEVKREIRQTGNMGEPQFSSPLIKKAVQGMGGWRSLCMAPDDEWVRKDFIKAFETYSERAFSELLHTPNARQLAQIAQEKIAPQIEDEYTENAPSIADYKRMLAERGHQT